MECADVPDVSNAERSGDLFNVVSLAEALRQCKLGFSTDKMVGDNKVLTARCRSAECQYRVNCVGNRCGSHGVCRVKATSTVVHLNDHTCECDSGFVQQQELRCISCHRQCWARVLERHQVRGNCHPRESCAVLAESVP